MKKYIVIIIVLLLVFFGMFFYRKNQIKQKEVTMQDVEKIEEYVNKLYKWKEVTDEALPLFENINDAPDKWVWQVVKDNLETYEMTYSQIQDRSKRNFWRRVF